MDQNAAKTAAEIGRLLKMLHPDYQKIILQKANACLMEQTGLKSNETKRPEACEGEKFVKREKGGI